MLPNDKKFSIEKNRARNETETRREKTAREWGGGGTAHKPASKLANNRRSILSKQTVDDHNQSHKSAWKRSLANAQSRHH